MEDEILIPVTRGFLIKRINGEIGAK